MNDRTAGELHDLAFEHNRKSRAFFHAHSRQQAHELVHVDRDSVGDSPPEGRVRVEGVVDVDGNPLLFDAGEALALAAVLAEHAHQMTAGVYVGDRERWRDGQLAAARHEAQSAHSNLMAAMKARTNAHGEQL